MTLDLISRLGAVKFGNVSNDPGSDLSIFETRIDFSLPETLRNILLFFGSAIVFEKRVKFKPNQRTMLEGEDVHHGLGLLFGVAQDRNGLREKNIAFQEQLLSGLVAFGESNGGNLVCLEKTTGRVVFWHHEAVSDDKSVFEISTNLDDFLKSLTNDTTPEQSKAQGIVSEKSFLDF